MYYSKPQAKAWDFLRKKWIFVDEYGYEIF